MNPLWYPIYTEQNDLDRNLDQDLDPEILSCKHLIWIAIWINLIQILGGLQCNNDWTTNNNVMSFVVVYNDLDAERYPDSDLDNFLLCKRKEMITPKSSAIGRASLVQLFKIKLD